jgi:hypothetical protein
MVTGFLPVEKPNDVGALALEFRSAVGAIAEYERVQDVIHSAPHESVNCIGLEIKTLHFVYF